jgi:hypothetical protein
VLITARACRHLLIESPVWSNHYRHEAKGEPAFEARTISRQSGKLPTMQPLSGPRPKMRVTTV